MSFDSVTLADRIQRRRSGYSLEQPFYVDPAIFEIDLDRIYRRHWLLAGPTCRLAQSGDFFTYQIANDSLVILRDDTGEVRAFHNVCRHRGSRVCLDEQGHAKRLVCPYHNWAYGLDGALCSARRLPADGRDHPRELESRRRELLGVLPLCPDASGILRRDVIRSRAEQRTAAGRATAV